MDTTMGETPSEESTVPNIYPSITLGTSIPSTPIIPSTSPIRRQPETTSPVLPGLNVPTQSTFNASLFNFQSNPFVTQPSEAELSAQTHRQPSQNRKRGLSTSLFNQNKHQRTYLKPLSAKEAILEARDLIVMASTMTTSRDEQTKLLDLLEIFREYTEKGRLTAASNIITTQITNLETASRKIETHAKTLAKAPATTISNSSKNIHQEKNPMSKPLSFAAAAAQGNNLTQKSQEWTLVSKANTAKPPQRDKKKDLSERRLILIKSSNTSSESFSPLTARNQINAAFGKAGIKGPVVASVAKTFNQNLVITTSEAFTAQFLLEKKVIWNHLLQFSKIQKDQIWHKVILHKIPIADFSGPEGMDLIKEEIRTFNKGLNPIGNPYWLTTAEKRVHQRAGAVVVAFATEQEANMAIRNRLYVAGISVRVEQHYSTAPSMQCQRCQGFGHHDFYCKREVSCGLCSEKHATKQHHCNICHTKGARCPHLAPKCSNCKEAHTANARSCEILRTIKQKANATRSL